MQCDRGWVAGSGRASSFPSLGLPDPLPRPYEQNYARCVSTRRGGGHVGQRRAFVRVVGGGRKGLLEWWEEGKEEEEWKGKRGRKE